MAIVTDIHFKESHQEKVCHTAGFQTFKRYRRGRRGAAWPPVCKKDCNASLMPEVLEISNFYESASNHHMLEPSITPCPTYESGTLLAWLDRTTHNLTHEYGGVLITLGGYLNSLNVDDVAEPTGLHPMVIEPTHGFMVQCLTSTKSK